MEDGIKKSMSSCQNYLHQHDEFRASIQNVSVSQFEMRCNDELDSTRWYPFYWDQVVRIVRHMNAMCARWEMNVCVRHPYLQKHRTITKKENKHCALFMLCFLGLCWYNRVHWMEAKTSPVHRSMKIRRADNISAKNEDKEQKTARQRMAHTHEKSAR